MRKVPPGIQTMPAGGALPAGLGAASYVECSGIRAPGCIENHLVMPPELFEETADSVTLAARTHDHGEVALAVDRIEHRLLLRVDRQIDIGIRVAAVDQHPRRARRQPPLNADRVRQPDRHIAKPSVTGKTDLLHT